MNVKLSVIIPVFNAEQYLEQCLNSILEQSYTDLEIICIEDVSSDNSKCILEKYAIKDKRIKVYYNEKNQGQSFARNKGLLHAVGQYILFVDSDDYLVEGILKRIIEEAEVMQLEVLSFDAKTVCDFGESNLYNGIRKKEYCGVRDGIQVYVEQMSNGDYKCSVWQYLYRKDFLTKHNIEFIENIYHEDEMFMFCVYMNAKRMAFIREVGYIYRFRENSTMTDENKRVKRIKDLVYIYHNSLFYFESLKIDIKEPLKMYLDYLRQNIVINYRKCTLEQKLECTNYQNPILKHIFYRIINMYEELELEQDEIEYLQKQNNLYLYGAGEYAKRWIYVFNEYNIEIEGIIVTHLDSNQNKLFGYTIYEAAKLCTDLSEDILIFPAVHKNKIPEICNSLSMYSKVLVYNSRQS